MDTEVTILHADLDGFYASVEQLLNPSLRGKPVAVGGCVVLAASYEAKAFGVRGGMPGRKAQELCPQLIFGGGNFKGYQRLGTRRSACLATSPRSLPAARICLVRQAALRECRRRVEMRPTRQILPRFSATKSILPIERRHQRDAVACQQHRLKNAIRAIHD